MERSDDINVLHQEANPVARSFPPTDATLTAARRFARCPPPSDGRSSLRQELCVVSYSPPSKKDKAARTMEFAMPKVKGFEAEGGVENWQPTR